MPKKKRTFEADVAGAQALKLQPRLAETDMDQQRSSRSKNQDSAHSGVALSKDLILRLIDRIKDK